jgi:hypothetical protein
MCQTEECDFLVAVEVKSFDSGDSNRDLHMMQVVRGARYPLVIVRTRLKQSYLALPVIHVDLEIQLAGHTGRYKQVDLQRSADGHEVRISATIPATRSDFGIDPPSLLAIPIRNEMPVRVDMTWRPV